ncbi:DUF5655 domain-containing protein [Mucilaginibacter lappiensis]|uniref:Putative transport protein n=1 Tax=Mucilaginibacter lappiensis TaxID=354630 RepID=A0A841J5Q9_9SPHI|nr:DUF5655 domain-containing protein [Mucilaginibacter lappiensis]MBB6126353.1 putative transport protein [Mucilaginibacter lappiensis]
MLERGSDEACALYEQFKNSILNLTPEIEVHPKKEYIAIKKGKNITDITALKKSVKLWINLKKGTLDDPKMLTEDVSAEGKWGNGDYQPSVEDDRDMEYIMSLVRQAIH